MERNMFKKVLVVEIIVMFIGVSIAPGITATIHLSENTTTTTLKSEEIKSDLVEIIVQVCGTEWGKESKVKISIEVYNELKNLFDNLKIRLDNSKTREERNSILNNAIISLDNLGILPEYINVEELQQIVTVANHNFRSLNLLEWLILTNPQQSYSNYFCQITGEATIIDVFGILDFFIPFLLEFRFILEILLDQFPTTWIKLYKFLSFGVIKQEWGGWPAPKPSAGWIRTYGTKGDIKLEGKFFGGMSTISQSDFEGDETTWHIGVSNFRGIRIIRNLSDYESYIMGRARIVNLDPYEE